MLFSCLYLTRDFNYDREVLADNNMEILTVVCDIRTGKKGCLNQKRAVGTPIFMASQLIRRVPIIEIVGML